ncbi:putative proton-dependent oligopeptide transporter family [Helianthus annuus]|nr:putative proton-dependent oligopeptide transporter family [Helianthus annuus]
MGFAFSTLAMAVSAIVEHVRRQKAIQQGFRDNAHAVINMSAMWLVPQYCLHGLAEALSIIGQNEFYYSELPKLYLALRHHFSCSAWLWLTCWLVLY